MRIEPEERRYRLPPPPAAVETVLGESPAIVPALAATVAFLVLAATEAGFYPTAWYAAALFILGLLVATVIAVGLPRAVPKATLAALGLFAGFTVWSYLSITWADQQGVAWDGANRTAMYLLVFAIFTLWPMGETGGRLVLGLFGLGMAGIGLVELLRADAAAEPARFFIDLRFAEPAGYINANVALWTLGLFACLFTAASRQTPLALRPLAFGGAGLLAALALMGQSRGWALALPVALVIFLIVTPGRVRLLGTLGVVALATFLIREPVLDVHDEVGTRSLDGLLQDATAATMLAVVGLLLVGLAWALVDRRVELGHAASRRLGRTVGGAVGVLAVGGAALALAAGEPADRLSTAWDEFKTGTGGQDGSEGGSRFSTAGSNRYDFWETAWELFKEEPVRGIGSENFQVEYLRRGTSTETPRYPHSLEMGVISQTGLVGALLLVGTLLAAALAAVWNRAGPVGRRAVAGGAIGVSVYWLLHASVDWLWEFPGLTAPAIAMIGMAGALAPRAAQATDAAGVRHVPAAFAVAAAVPLALSLAFPWFAALQVDRATDGWRSDPETALDRLDTAADLNPLSNEAQLTAATIALSAGDTARARTEFAAALDRDPETAYALLELGAMAAERGERATALALLRRALVLTPRDEVTRETLLAVRRGRPVSVERLNRRIVRRARSLTENEPSGRD
jgi:O-Antigen ligase/Tetratricopeptide repeat